MTDLEALAERLALEWRERAPGKWDILKVLQETVPYRIRELLWSLHTTVGDGHGQYGDDGELQCSGVDGACDFRRAPLDEIEEHIRRRGLRLLAEAARRMQSAATSE